MFEECRGVGATIAPSRDGGRIAYTDGTVKILSFCQKFVREARGSGSSVKVAGGRGRRSTAKVKTSGRA